jgi:hypothetical protein
VKLTVTGTDFLEPQAAGLKADFSGHSGLELQKNSTRSGTLGLSSGPY